MCDPDLMEVISFCQEGEMCYNKGNIKEAIESFENALKKAKSTKDRHLENMCIYNLTSVHAAKGDKQNWEQNLKDLSYKFIEDDLPEGESSMTYLQAVADQSPWQYEKALEVTTDSKKQIYLLKQLVKQCKVEQDIHKQIKYLKRLQTVYEAQREDIRCLEVACQRARLLFRENNTKASRKVLKEVEMELGEYDKTRTTSWGTQERRCPVPIWNELGLMYTLLKKEDKALQCFENGLKLIHDKNAASILKTAVLKQNIGAVRYMKDDFALAKKSHEEAIQQYEALKDDKTAATGAARSYISLGEALVKLGRIMDASEAFSQANDLARTAGDRHTTMQACEALASVAMKHNDTRAARRYLEDAMHFIMEVPETVQEVPETVQEVHETVQGVGADQPAYTKYNYQRIAEKLSKLPWTPHDSP